MIIPGENFTGDDSLTGVEGAFFFFICLMSFRRNRPISPFSYAGKGFVSCKDGVVTISTTDLTENRSTAFTVAA